MTALVVACSASAYMTDIHLSRLKRILEKTKNGSRLVLLLVGEALTVARMLAATSQDGYLLPRRSGNPWGHYRTAWQRAVQRARLEEEFSFHSLRHTAASYMVQAGIPDRAECPLCASGN